jgi:hypothetical protein
MARQSIPAAQLYAVLDREFRALRQCDRCRVPLPYWQEAPDEVSTNWLVGTPTECPNGCHLVIVELMAHLWTRYELTVPPQR